ncbi:MAG: pyridoxamine kinase [Candidatus Liptonbacteria bacterium]|nr:pyridoxamine kinase [Candidatus Liptonbacteria bacterium]
MQNMIRRVAAIHDLSGFGKASLTIVIPTLSSMGIQVCPLPTAILSTHTGGFIGFSFLDLTDEMERIVAHWKTVGARFEAIYSGFLGSPRQVDIVSRFIDDFRGEGQLVVVDPVLADDGQLYQTMGPEMVEGMGRLVAKANVVTPNLTELALLVGEAYREEVSLDEIKRWMRELSTKGPNYIVVTSVPVRETGQSSVIGLDAQSNRFWRVKNEKVPVSYPGTGDTFTSVFLGSMMRGESFPTALDRAVQFVSLAIRWSFGFDHEHREGVAIEAVLHTLQQHNLSYTYESV